MKYAVLIVAGFVLAVAGFMVGRAHPVHPAHHYERLNEDGPLLLDTSTGRVCDPFRDAHNKAATVNAAIDKTAEPAVIAIKPDRVSFRDMIPACGSE